MNRWRVRAYRPGEEEGINRAFSQVFGKFRTLAEWHWKFLGQGLPPYIMLAVGEPDRVLAQYACVPVRFQTPAGQVLAGQVVDVFSIPQARTGLAAGRAYLEAMARFFEEWGKPDQLAILFGFPSHRPLKLGKLTGRYSQIPDQAVLRLRWGAQPRSRLSDVGVTAVWGIAPTVLEDLWQEHGSRLPYAAIRDAPYFRWRYLKKPGAHYEGLTVFRGEKPLGSLILRHLGNAVALVDWAAPPDPVVWQQLLTGVVRSGFIREAQGLEAWLAGDDATAQALQSLGFTREPHDQVRLAVRLFHPDLDPQLVPGRFYVTWGDTDLI